ncbi:PepSY-associated TM helix domain-containing protein [Neobacillus soli]|uniref:PepSY-associated TM helix domain-containing protein n=1 Tax=Neobacillus soli TaxID=220688 RepID=UPI0008252B81|nr:PepSY-associated TM helix domain-containing protein [Neobacillus soli]
MKKTRRLHLWIGLIASVFIFMESLTGLLMNEPWLIGQSQIEGGRGNFQPGQFNQGQFLQGNIGGWGQGTGQNQGQAVNPQQGQSSGQTQGQTGTDGNGKYQRRSGFGGNGNLAGRTRGEGIGKGSLISTIRGLHEGRIGNTEVKWFLDLVAIAMMFLTGTGIYLSIKVLGAERKRKKRQEENLEVM